MYSVSAASSALELDTLEKVLDNLENIFDQWMNQMKWSQGRRKYL